MYIIYGTLFSDSKTLSLSICINVSSNKDKLPAILFLLALYHLLNLIIGILPAGILHSVRSDYKDGLFRPFFRSCILMNVADMMDCSTYSIKKSRTSANVIFFIRHLLNLINRNSVMQHFASIIKQHRRYICFLTGFFLLLHHRIETTDCVRLKSSHRPASIQNINDFC